jgi:3-oxoacyl-[acyl-carrier protein] reductase
MSVVRFSRLVAPIMKENKFGRIINITSIIAKSPSAGMGLSASLRAGVLGFAKTLALETARDGITVNSLCPGAVETDRFRRLMELDAADEKTPLAAMREKVRQGIPTGFIADPADFAQAILFLASPEARYITGTALSVDGGEYRGLM